MITVQCQDAVVMEEFVYVGVLIHSLTHSSPVQHLYRHSHESLDNEIKHLNCNKTEVIHYVHFTARNVGQ